MTQPKILIFTTTKSGTGVARFNEHIADAILRAGWTAILAQPEEPDYRGRMADCSAAERHFFRRDPYADIVGFGADRFLPAILFGETRPDLVVFSSGIHPLTTVAGMQAAHFFRIPYVTVDGLVAPSLYDWDENALTMVSRLYGNAEAVIVKSQESLGALRQCLRLPADVGSVIVSGRPDRYFEPRDETRRAALRRHCKYRTTASCVSPRRSWKSSRDTRCRSTQCSSSRHGRCGTGCISPGPEKARKGSVSKPP